MAHAQARQVFPPGLQVIYIQIISHALQCILSETQLKSSGEQLKSRDLFLDADIIQFHSAVRLDVLLQYSSY